LNYDIDFNVSNLMLAAVKHNPDAPILLKHWYPQLVICDRYKNAHQRNFDFTWDDVQNADIEELDRYYKGLGYDEIPTKPPKETGIIAVEDMDEEEAKMAAFEAWMLDVYNAEWDKKDFDDDDIKHEDNVFNEDFEIPQHPDLPTWQTAEADMEAFDKKWKEQHDEDEEFDQAYKDFYGQKLEYTPEDGGDGFIEDFRGLLVIACADINEDLETAEAITTRMTEEFGDKIYTETRIMTHVFPEDNVFEVWLESYEVDLLHSRRRNYLGMDDWDGPANVDDAQLEYLVNEVRKLTSEDARLSTPVYEMKIEA